MFFARKFVSLSVLMSLLLAGAVTVSYTSSAKPKKQKQTSIKNVNEVLWATSKSGKFPIQSFKFPIPKERVSSWSNLYENRAGIPYQAWKSVADEIQKSKSKIGAVSQFIGPNTIPTYPDLSNAMSLVSRAFPAAKEVTATRVFIYSYTDLDWATETYNREFSNETGNFKRFHSDSIRDNCDSKREVCWAQGYIDSSANGVILLGIPESGTSIRLNQTFDEYARSDLGLTIAHEYFHTIQRKILGDNWYQMEYTPPTWFNEGSATFVENAAMNNNSWNSFMQYRIASSKLLLPKCQGGVGPCVTINEELLNDFFSLKHYENNWGNFPYAFKYEVSSRIIEVLVAIGGPNSLIKLLDRMSERFTFEEAFEFAYKISYKEATPVISKIIAEQFVN